jgi:hypothetical protein
MLTEQTVLLAGPNGRVVATRYAFGVALVAAVYIAVLVVWGRAISLPARSVSSSPGTTSGSSRRPRASSLPGSLARMPRTSGDHSSNSVGLVNRTSKR